MHVRIGDLDGYRNVCVRMHARFGKSDGWNENAHLAHACCLAPKALADLTTPRQHAEKRLALTPNTKIPWIHHMLGLAHYRAGEYEQAVLRIKKCQRENPRWPINMVNELLLAMAQHQLKRDDEARSHLEIAKAAIRAVLSGNPPSHKGFAPKGWHWRDWLTVELLHREASDLVSK